MARQKKENKFDILPEAFKDAVSSMSEDEIRKRISEVALDEHNNQRLKKEDQDLEQKKVLAKEAGEQYSEATKTNRAKIAYCSMILESRGKI